MKDSHPAAPVRDPSYPAGPLTQDDLQDWHCLCDECYGDPDQYLLDYEKTCPCGGLGYRDDPDWSDPDEPGFDPVREYGTLKSYQGRMS